MFTSSLIAIQKYYFFKTLKPSILYTYMNTCLASRATYKFH